ncbi:molybdopterin-dependent oxidoreductase [Brevibacillus nitrificans]|uniref:molybdopterin-dependent oxidoreductase n=1 Tax=Brevibacillus nitrificans TaxID=651560 RepID=UPI00285A7B02|nr:molybdopterin-dependent oxidoreductase [Brevibacillus nitrificans]MDR7315205.1 DMSO/TMAO reductase YedYZ molybdopterin-dependent catalytic subunit [Brevibacillus nitrificans]
MMEQKGWLKWKLGKKLNKLHAWNAYVILLLAVTGVVLYIPALREVTAPIRVGLKQLHIVLGILSSLLLCLYLPLLSRHVKQLLTKKPYLLNLAAVLFLITGWTLSGFLLWWERALSPYWTSAALSWHDWLSWFGIPYVLYHSITRSRAINQSKWVRPETLSDEPKAPGMISRRSFVRLTASTLFALAIGPLFYRWVKRLTDDGGVALADMTQKHAEKADLYQLTPHTDSLPPIGGGAEGQFRVYTVTDIPAFVPADWSFAISGLIDHPLTYSWREFSQMPRSVQVSDFHCVTGWSVYHVTWEGIPLRTLLEKAGVKPEARFVKFLSGDGVYTDTLTLEQARLDDVMVAVLIDGKPIPDEFGGPVRLVVPKMYAYKSVKWLQQIELIAQDHIGYWELRGYDADAWIPGIPQKSG